MRALREADSVAVDPYKWLYAPIEAGCCLVRDAGALRDAFAFNPPYYSFDEGVVNFFDYGPQNTRGFRALKVWLALQQVGADGYRRMMRDDMALAALLGQVLDARPDFERRTVGLSIVTFRYVPVDLRARRAEPGRCSATSTALNRALLDVSQSAGEVFVSNAVTDGDVRAARLHRELPHDGGRRAGRAAAAGEDPRGASTPNAALGPRCD